MIIYLRSIYLTNTYIVSIYYLQVIHLQGEDVFLKKLIPHIYMSKDEFPQTMTPNDVLEKMFLFMEDWKSKLYDMISFNSVPRTEVPVLQIPNQVRHESNISSI